MFPFINILHLFIHLSIDGRLVCFHIFAVVNSVAVNIEVHVSFQITVLPGYMSSSQIDRSYGNAVLDF